MRAALAFLLITGAVIAADKPESTVDYHGRVLDSSPRARTYSLWNTISVTKAEFRRMQQRYRPQDFEMWAKRLRQLRPGKSEKQVLQVLQLKTAEYEVISGQTVWITIILSDAYFAAIFIDPHTKRMISASPPLANTYEIESDQKKTPKT
jgi:hypothetical protein